MQKALNRGAAYHRLRRTVAYVNGGKFWVQTEAEQQVWNECSRLIANAIIYYNTALLSRVYAQKQSAQDQAAMVVIPPPCQKSRFPYGSPSSARCFLGGNAIALPLKKKANFSTDRSEKN